MDSLFRDRIRTDVRGAGYGEDDYSYLDRSARPMAERIRTFLDATFSAVPDARLQLRNRFRSRRREQHRGALLELVTLAVLSQQGLPVEIEPDLAGTTSKPDFRVLHMDRPVFVECTTANDSEAGTAADRRLFGAIDALDEVESELWTVSFQCPATGPEPLRSSEFKRAVSSWLSSLAPGSESEEPDPDDPDDRAPRFKWEQDGWLILLHAYELRPGSPRSGVRGIVMSEVLAVDSHARIRRAITGKAGKYGSDPGAPLVIVVVPTVDYAWDESLLEAVIGDKDWKVNLATREFRQSLKRNGAFLTATGYRSTAASAVLFAPRFDAWSLPQTNWTLVHHPAPKHVAPKGLFPFSKEIDWDADGVAVETPASLTFNDYFNLPAEWPGPEPRPSESAESLFS